MTLVLDERLLQQARTQALNRSEPLLSALQQLSASSPEAVLAAVQDYTACRLWRLAEMEAVAPDFAVLGYGDCLQRGCIVLRPAEGAPVFVSSNPFDEAVLNWASYQISGVFEMGFAHPVELKALLHRLEGHEQALSQLVQMETTGASSSETTEISLTSIAQDESQVVRLVNSTLYDAHKAGASDIHLENTAQGLVIKYRIDGVLGMIRQIPDIALAEQVVSRLKVLAELDIGEKRVPQDGRFAVSLEAREVDFRVSIMPGLFGEDAVLRILDKQSLSAELKSLSLDILGFDPESCQTIRRLASQPYGMLLVTGPTGSGKTTSLYATLSEINHGDDKIITIEDPVEYQLPGVLQIPVNERKGLTFARGLRSILRHDPDKILVGEIRDRETAEIAVQAALTGHLVFTTVHANSVFDVISRFRHIGLDAYSLVTALNGIVAQRLVRLICSHCSEPHVPDDQTLVASGLRPAEVRDVQFRRGRGCPHCRGTGYKGRRALAEILVLNDETRELILQQAPLSRLKERAQALGLCLMREQALAAVKAGKTTLQEINRVTFVE
jgi:general secretion pathway protein E